MSDKFRRTKENFICGQCGAPVEGDGFTNHCPICLWSKHVDDNPGDRANACLGLMEPEAIELEGRTYRIVHRCVRCGTRKRNVISRRDNEEAVMRIAERKGSAPAE